MRSSVRRSLAASAVLALTSVPAMGAVASAAPDSDTGNQPAHAGKPADKSGTQGKPADKPAKPGKPTKSAKPAKPGDQEKPAKLQKPATPETPAKPADKPAKPVNPGKSDDTEDTKNNPPGNNGTVKIAGPGDAEGHPSNNPHPGCTFFVEWYGFDEGADIISSVTFTPHAPTADVVLSGTTPAEVPVGGDAAGGGTDLDGREAYTLQFDGEPHPQQGYHVKLTVNTPSSHGSDKKSKVFWVEPCETETTPVLPGEESEDGTTTPGVDSEGGTTDEDETAGETVGEENVLDVIAEDGDVTASDALGIELFADDDAAADDEAATAPGAARAGVTLDSAAEVPTSVDAGLAAFGDWARSPLPLALAGLGAAAALGGLAYRRRVAGQ